MTMPTYTPPTSPYARDPFYAMGAADAYDEHKAGLGVHDLKRRADEMLDVPSTGRDSTDLYVCGYANAVIGLMNTHIAQTNAQADVAQTWLARKQAAKPAPSTNATAPTAEPTPPPTARAPEHHHTPAPPPQEPAMARTPSARTTKTAATKKTASKKAPRTRKQTPPPLSLVKPIPPRPRPDRRTRPWMTDLQGYATLAALIAGITTPTIQAWHDHHDGTTTRTLNDGTHLHYTLTTRTLSWQTPCPMGAVHEYTLRNPADTDAAQADAEGCTRLHWTPPPTNTGTHLAARLQTAHKAAADTQPLTLADITAGLEARADQDQPKGHPEP